MTFTFNFDIKVSGFFFFCTYKIFYQSIVDLQCYVVSGIQQSDSVICIHVFILFQIFFSYRLEY